MNELLAAARRVCEEFVNVQVDDPKQRESLIKLWVAVQKAEYDTGKNNP